jgi:large subunit ribosomal protein L21
MIKKAVIKTGGKQYLVSPNQEVEVEKIAGKKGDKLVFDQVLLVVADVLKVGFPLVKGAKVQARIVEQFKDKKIRVATYKAKSRYRKVKGHRQQKTKVKILKIITS